jgi:hypothetical protein
MGLITGILGLPLAPLRGVVAVAEQLHRAAEDQFYDPGLIKRQLEEVERMRADGRLDDDEATAWEDELIERLVVARERPRRSH